MNETKIILSEREMPAFWYNIMPDLPNPPVPPLHPGTGRPIGPADLTPIFPMALIEQEVSGQREIPIPQEVLDIYRLWRPRPSTAPSASRPRSRPRPASTTSTRE